PCQIPPFIKGGQVIVADDPVEHGIRLLMPELFQCVDRVGNRTALELAGRDLEPVMIFRREHSHRKSIEGRGGLLFFLERLPGGRHVDDAIPADGLARRKNGMQMTMMKRIERAAAYADSHNSSS